MFPLKNPAVVLIEAQLRVAGLILSEAQSRGVGLGTFVIHQQFLNGTEAAYAVPCGIKKFFSIAFAAASQCRL